MTHMGKVTASPSTPGNVTPLLGSSPLLTGEDPEQYSRLLQTLHDAVQPGDIFEQVWAREIADLMWEAWRYRGLLVRLMHVTEQKALERVLQGLVDNPVGLESGFRTKSDLLAWQYMLGEKGKVAEVNRLLESANLTWDDVKAEALALRITEVEQINRMIMAAEARRNVSLREIERHRAGFGQTLRTAARQIEDADYRVIKEERQAA